MKLRVSAAAKAIKSVLLDESGQAMTEYISMTMLGVLGTFAALSAAPFVWMVFKGLQIYVDFYLYSLNIAVG